MRKTTNINFGSSSGIGISSLLTVLFIGLKLTSRIKWSWFWVLSPTLIPFFIGLFIILTVLWFKTSKSKRVK